WLDCNAWTVQIRTVRCGNHYFCETTMRVAVTSTCTPSRVRRKATNAMLLSVANTPLTFTSRNCGAVISIGVDVYRLNSLATRYRGSLSNMICRRSQAVVRCASTATGVAGQLSG